MNIATILLFLLPFALYFGDQEKLVLYVGLVVASLLLSLIMPPIGWMRPHPYSDVPGNEPLRMRKIADT